MFTGSPVGSYRFTPGDPGWTYSLAVHPLDGSVAAGGSDGRSRRISIATAKRQLPRSPTCLGSFHRVVLFIEEPRGGGKGFLAILLDDLNCSDRGKASFFTSL